MNITQDPRTPSTTLKQALDDIAHLAACICGASNAAVSLVDSHYQRSGDTKGFTWHEAGRDLIDCSQIPFQSKLFIVPDALHGYQTADHPNLKGSPNICFYASLPLIRSDGFAVGALQISDTMPKHLNAGQVAALAILGKSVLATIHREEESRESDKESKLRQENFEKRHQCYFDQSLHTTFSMNLQGYLLSADCSCEALTGYTSSELMGRRFELLIRPEDYETVHEKLLQVAHGKPQSFETAIAHKSKGFVPVAAIVAPIIVNEVISGMYSIVEDISLRKQKEVNAFEHYRAHQESDAIMAEAQRMGHVGSWELYLKSDNVVCSEEMLRIYGFEDGKTPQNEAGMRACYYGGDLASYDQAVADLRLSGRSVHQEIRGIRPDGEIFWCQLTMHAVRDELGEASRFWGTTTDITQRKRAELQQQSSYMALRQIEEELQAVVDESVCGIYLFDPGTGQILKSNTALQNMLGYSAEQMVSLTVYDIIAHNESSIDSNIEAMLVKRRLDVGERQYLHQSGTLLIVEVSGRVIRYGSREAYCVTVYDVTKRAKSESVLLAEREFQRALLESLQEGIIACDARGKLTLLNETARSLHGIAREAPIGIDFPAFDLYDSDGVTAMQTADIPLLRALRGEKVVEAEVVISRVDSTKSTLLVNGQAMYDVKGVKLGAVVAMRDVTERKRAEEELRLLLEISNLLSASLDYEKTLQSIARLVVPSLADFCFFDLLADNGVLKRVAWAHADPQKQSVLDAAFGKSPPRSDRRNQDRRTKNNPVLRVLKTGRSEFVPTVSDAWMRSAATSPEELETMQQLGLVSLMTLPLITRGTALGALTLCYAQPGRHHTAAQMDFGQELCNRVAVAVQNARLLQAALDQADCDPLTDLINHRAFQRKLEDESDRARQQGTFLVVVMLDLNGFKFFDDVYGHLVGDGVLRQLALRLKSICRPFDTVARFGGDEFALLMPSSSTVSPIDIETRLREKLSDFSYRPDGHITSIPLTFSVGAGVVSMHSMDGQEALQHADQRLIRSKTGADQETEAEAVRVCVQDQVAGFPMLDALVTAVDNKDRYTKRHSEDVMRYSLTIAKALGFNEVELQCVAVAALIHDVGKIGVPDSVLRKPGQLTDDEFAAVKQHPEMGAIIVQAVPGLEYTLDAIRHHHERWDGAGYPHGLKGNATPQLARLMAVADAYSAMTTDRPYRRGMSSKQAVSILAAGAGSQWDPECVTAFLSSLEEGGD